MWNFKLSGNQEILVGTFFTSGQGGVRFLGIWDASHGILLSKKCLGDDLSCFSVNRYDAHAFTSLNGNRCVVNQDRVAYNMWSKEYSPLFRHVHFSACYVSTRSQQKIQWKQMLLGKGSINSVIDGALLHE